MKFNSYAVTYICKNQFNYPQCFDLIHDPIDYIGMSTQDLKARMKLKPKIIKEVKNNKNPILMDESYVKKISKYDNVGLNILKERASIIKNNEEFKSKIQRILFEENEEKEMTKSQDDIKPEDSLYVGGFPDNDDKSKMVDFHKADWDEKIYISNKFRDQRYKYFAQRLIYEESPHSLPISDYNQIHKIVANQVLSTDNEKWNTIPKSYHQLDNLRIKYEEEKDDEKLSFVEEINNYLEEISNFYEKS